MNIAILNAYIPWVTATRNSIRLIAHLWKELMQLAQPFVHLLHLRFFSQSQALSYSPHQSQVWTSSLGSIYEHQCRTTSIPTEVCPQDLHCMSMKAFFKISYCHTQQGVFRWCIWSKTKKRHVPQCRGYQHYFSTFFIFSSHLFSGSLFTN